MSQSATIADAQAALDAGATVVTVNNRLARALAAAFAGRMRAQGRTAWETPSILPFDGFVLTMWRDLEASAQHELPRLLSSAEARALWQQEVSAAGGDALLSRSAAAAAAAGARELLLRYRAILRHEDCGDDLDARTFAGWHQRFQARLEHERWVDRPAALDELVQHLESGAFPPPSELVFIGFEQFTPQQDAFLAALAGAGADVRRERPAAAALAACQVHVESPDAEIEAAARWARALLEAGTPGPIGIVLVDLAQRLDRVEACFEDLLHPATGVAPRAPQAARAYNVTLGRALVQTRVVSDALAVLELCAGRVDAVTAGHVLLSPYLKDHQHERGARLALEALLRDQGVRVIGSRHLARLARRHAAVSLSRRLSDAMADAPHPRARLPLAEHAARLAAVLATLGWPAGRALDSHEHQAVEAFRGRLEALATMDSVLDPCPASTALATLRGELSATVFQPRAAPAPVQVMGVLEAAGMSFEALWLGGFHDAVWPALRAPQPLLPIALQRRHDMPGASAQRSLARAHNLTARLLGAAPQVVVSHALRDGETPQRVSPLLAHLPLVEAGTIARWPGDFPDAAVLAVAPPLEWLPDGAARGVGHGWRARGGSRVLTDQAACPFRAFARHRLRARGVARAPAPLDARSRGILAHRVMQELFTRIGGLDALLAVDDTARAALCEDAARAAVGSVLRRHPGMIPERLADAERTRMQALAVRWLALESRRAPFQVEALEQRRVVRIGGLRLDIQLDRVDRIDSRRMLIDYKTGRAERGGWFGERPDDPQLPLYALALDAEGMASAPVAAVCFARLKRGAEGFEGVAEDADWAVGLSAFGAGRGAQREFADMAALKRHWDRVLGDLANAFAAGDAQVDPKRGACRLCDLRTLCRVDELGGSPVADDA